MYSVYQISVKWFDFDGAVAFEAFHSLLLTTWFPPSAKTQPPLTHDCWDRLQHHLCTLTPLRISFISHIFTPPLLFSTKDKHI